MSSFLDNSTIKLLILDYLASGPKYASEIMIYLVRSHAGVPVGKIPLEEYKLLLRYYEYRGFTILDHLIEENVISRDEFYLFALNAI